MFFTKVYQTLLYKHTLSSCGKSGAIWMNVNREYRFP